MEKETTMNVAGDGLRELRKEALSLLRAFGGNTESARRQEVDDLLLFLYRLHDGYRLRRRTGSSSEGTSFGFLNAILYQLESRPEATLRSEEWRSHIESLLLDLAEGRLPLSKRDD